MRVGVIVTNKLTLFEDKYIRLFKDNNIPHEIISPDNALSEIEEKKITHCIYRWSHYDDDKQAAHTILPIIENELGVKCFPNQDTCWHYDDKIRQYYLLSSKGYPITKSWIFWERKRALQWEKTAELPVVFKTTAGAGSSNVVLVKDRKNLKKIINVMFLRGVKTRGIPLPGNVKWKDFNPWKKLISILARIKRRIDGRYRIRNWQIQQGYVLFQRFLPENDFDIRVTVIGGRAFAFRRMNRKNDFRSSGSGIIDYDMSEIDLDYIKLALKVSKEMGFQSMAYDMLRNEKGEPEFCEISYTYVDKAVYNCPGYWDEDLNWHEGHFWPQYWQVVDFIGKDDLKMSEVKD